MSVNIQQEFSTATDIASSISEDWAPLSRSPLLDAVNTIIVCLAVLGNGMVITVMTVRRRVFGSFTNRLILHQSVIDLIAGVVFFVQQVVKDPNLSVSMEGNIYDRLICSLFFSDASLWCVYVVSTYNLVVISLERFLAICYPVKHLNTCTSSKFKIVVVIVWAIGLAYTMINPFLFEPHQGHCRMVDTGLALDIFLGVLVVVTEYIVPITIMTCAYTKILIALNKKSVRPGRPTNAVADRAKKNVFIITLLICIMFLLCWTPSEALLVAAQITGNSWNSSFYTVFNGLVACNMFINPIIYCFKYEHFRSQLKDLVLVRFRRNQVHIEESSSMNLS